MTEQKAEPAPRRKRRSSQLVHDLILEAAGIEFEAGGYAGATTAAIARRAKVTETQLFRFFPSKQELFKAAIFEPLNRHFAAFNSRHLGAENAAGGSRDAIVADYIGELQTFMEGHSRMLMSLIVASAFGPQGSEELTRIDGLRDYFDRGAAMMALRVGDDAVVAPELMVRVSFAAVLGNIVFRKFLFPDASTPDRPIREAVIDFVMNGIRDERPSPASPRRIGRE